MSYLTVQAQRVAEREILRDLAPLERDVVMEVKRALRTDETTLFGSAIIMMRQALDDEVW